MIGEWIEWHGENRIPAGLTPETLVQVAFSYDDLHNSVLPPTAAPADHWFWGRIKDDGEGNILFYRVVDDEPDPTKNKYHREIKKGVYVDVYDVLKAFDVRCPALQHLIKKALAAGQRGHKDLMTDLDDIIASANRAKELAK